MDNNPSNVFANTGVRCIADFTAEQLEDFLNSFDVVFSDCDGVLWNSDKQIPGAIETLRRLQELGKTIYLVTNNSAVSFKRYKEKVHGLDIGLVDTTRLWLFFNLLDTAGFCANKVFS
ncbi:uncharacterized protein LOC144477577 [Augochlora pura]